jgi:hypothetical protein
MGRTDMTAAPVQIPIDGRTYYLSPLSDQDFGEFERWVQDRYLDVAKRNLEGLTGADRETLLRVSYEKAAGLKVNSPEALGLMDTVDGASKLLQLALRHRHPEVTFAEAQRLCTNPVVVATCMDRILDMNQPLIGRHAAEKKKSRKARK